MECRSVIDSLSDYLDGSLAVQQVQIIETHLIQCSPCNAVKLDLAEICNAAKELPLRTPSQALWVRIQNEIQLEIAPAGKTEEKKSGWWKNWSEKKFTFNLPQLAGASALAFSLMVFGMYHALHRDPKIAASVVTNTVLPVEAEYQSQVRIKAEQLNLRRASWNSETRAAYDNHLQRIDSSMNRIRQACILSQDADQQKLLVDLYNEKLQLMEDFEKFEK